MALRFSRLSSRLDSLKADELQVSTDQKTLENYFCGCNTAEERMPHDDEVMGSNPAGC